MRIAVFVPSFPTVSETFILRQITGLIDLGHEVDIFAERSPEPGQPIHPDVAAYNLIARTLYTDRDMPAATGYWHLPVWPVTGQTWLPGVDRPITNFSRLLSATPAFTRCLFRTPRLTFHVLDTREYEYQARSLASLYRLAALSSLPARYDVLHAHFGSQGKTFRFARALLGAPLVVSFHGYDYSSLPRQQGRGLYQKLFKTADLITVNSEDARQKLEGLGCPPSKIRKLHYGIDLLAFPFRERRLVDGPVRILTIGRLVEKKGIEYAIRAVSAAAKRVSRPIRYSIIGEGPLRPQLESLVRELEMEGVIRLLGAQDGEFVRRALDEAHLFVLTSVTSEEGDQEGTPVSLLEAQASGLPVVSTLHAGIPEVVLDGRSGYLVPERDVGAASGRLVQLIEHPETWGSLGRAGRRHVEEHHEIGSVNRALERIYNEIVSV